MSARRPGTPDPFLQRADAPTLALSTVRLDVALLRQLMVFERTLRTRAPAGCSDEQTSQAHAAAIAASGMASSEVEAPLALLRRFAANRLLAASLSERLDRLSERAAHDAVASEQAELVRQRLIALQEALEGREDPETRSLLERHEAEILALFTGAARGA